MKKFLFLVLVATLALADIGKVTVVKGEASVNRDLKNIIAYNDMGLFKQDIVETAQGRLQMLFSDNTVISLGRESRFVIKEYLYEENSQNVVAAFKIEKGFIKTITGAIGKIMPGLFVLETSVTKIIPHGTIWSVQVDDESETYEVLEGRITLNFKDGSHRQEELHAGETATVMKTSNGVKSFHKTKFKNQIQKSAYEDRLEDRNGLVKEAQYINEGTIVDETGKLQSTFNDGNNGHGNDPSGFNPSNPGRKPPSF
ncbi:MAG: FecR domain-containing protein [Sulfurimonas sp.]